MAERANPAQSESRFRSLVEEYGLETVLYVAALVIVVFEIGRP